MISVCDKVKRIGDTEPKSTGIPFLIVWICILVLDTPHSSTKIRKLEVPKEILLFMTDIDRLIDQDREDQILHNYSN